MSIEKEVFPYMAKDGELFAFDLEGKIDNYLIIYNYLFLLLPLSSGFPLGPLGSSLMFSSSSSYSSIVISLSC